MWINNNIYSQLQPRAFFPFRRENDRKLSLEGIEKLIDYTYSYRLDVSTTKLDIARAVLDLVTMAHEWFKTEWGERIDYSLDEFRRRLRKEYGSKVLENPVVEQQ